MREIDHWFDNRGLALVSISDDIADSAFHSSVNYLSLINVNGISLQCEQYIRESRYPLWDAWEVQQSCSSHTQLQDDVADPMHCFFTYRETLYIFKVVSFLQHLVIC